MSAQAIRAVLLAKATATTSRGRLASKVGTSYSHAYALCGFLGVCATRSEELDPLAFLFFKPDSTTLGVGVWY